MQGSRYAFFGKTAIVLLALFIFGFIAPEKAEAQENLIFRFIAVNPSATKTQEIEVRKYLPKEVTPDDVVDMGELLMEYDLDKSMYYVYSSPLMLDPKEIRTFEVEISDIWTIHEDEFSMLENRVKSILTHFEATQYYAQGKAIADEVFLNLKEIRGSQARETSRQQHIGIYRDNLSTLEKIKEDIERMEKILVTAGGPPAPEMLTDTRVIADSPTKAMTWIVIFVIIIFIGLLGGVMFFTWQKQSGVTKEALLESKKSAFPGSEKGEGPTEG